MSKCFIIKAKLHLSILLSDDLSSVQVHTYFNHGVNGAFVLIDIWVTAMPIKALHFYIPTAFGLTWAIFALIYDFVGGTNGRNEPYIYQVSKIWIPLAANLWLNLC